MIGEKPFRVLTLDGGGMRGLYTATLLTKLTELFNKDHPQPFPDFGKGFDLICGTSTGSILACGLAAGVPIDALKDIYIKEGLKIFPSPMPEPQKPEFYLWAAKHAFVNSGDREELLKALKFVFQDRTLEDIYRERGIALCIAAVEAHKFIHRIFRTPHNPKALDDGEYKAYEAVLSSCTAPILFPVNKVEFHEEDEYYVDGGLWANNPVLLGMTEALQMIEDKDRPIEIISAGTCNRLMGSKSDLETLSWGMLKWATGMRLMELLLSSQASGTTYMANFFADYLTGLGRQVKVIRLGELVKTAEEFSVIHVDRADKEAVDMMTLLAEKDAEYIYDEMDGGTRKVFEDIYEGLPGAPEDKNPEDAPGGG
jgi:patatin-like phospholipase/acyl hydrolase